MKIWHISDTHGYHDLLEIPDGIDCVIHSGDCSNYRNPYNNEHEVRNFITWFSNIQIQHKIYVAGNHDTSIEKGLITKDNFKQVGINYLFNSTVIIEGFNIWGSPHTPNFGYWAFMKDRGKISRVWDKIPEDTDIVVCHGAPKAILDLTYNRNRETEMCGDSSLKKRILKLQPKLVLFGHIHNYKDIINAGTVKLSICDTIFSNGSVVTDNEFGKLSSNGNVFKI